jgi:YgiT-type zinc finger domain-containing protein
MMQYPKETLEEQLVTYTVEVNGKIYVVEHVPARVCLETGEQLFSPETVDRIQQIIREQPVPIRIIETPVYDFAA